MALNFLVHPAVTCECVFAWMGVFVREHIVKDIEHLPVLIVGKLCDNIVEGGGAQHLVEALEQLSVVIFSVCVCVCVCVKVRELLFAC